MQNFVSVWKNITTDPEILDIVKHYHINFLDGKLPQQDMPIHQIKFNNEQEKIVDSEIENLLKMQVIKEVKFDQGQFLSPIFLREKKNGENRLILNLKKLNEFLPYYHFKMDTFESTLNLITKDMYMCSIDLRHAYYSIKIAEEHQVYLRFSWKNKIFQFVALPNGLAHGPLIFTKLLKPVYSTLRNKGYISSGFIDDSFLGGNTLQECENNVHDTIRLMTDLGFLINEEKSVLIPSKKLVHLGFVIDSERMIVYLPDDKKENIITKCKSLLNQNRATIREVAQVLGSLVAAFSAVEFGKLHYRNLEMAKSLALKQNLGNFDAQMQISHSMKKDLTWWVKNVNNQYRIIDRGNPEVVIQTDSSHMGWAFVCEDVKGHGRWTLEEKQKQINVLEMKAIFFAIKSLCKQLSGKHVKVLTDSTTSVCYVTNMGGCKSVGCNDISKGIWNLCIENNIWLTCCHIAGKENKADFPSRHFNDNIEWELRQDIFDKICRLWEYPDIDLFASRLNHKVTQYCAFEPDPGAVFIDAFSINWEKYKCVYIFSPFSLLSRCIRKIQTDHAKAIIIVPLWKTQVWFPALLRILVDNPRLLPNSETLLQLKHLDKTHPMGKRLKLLACRVSGIHSETKVFHRKLPLYSLHLGDCQQNSSTEYTLKDGFSSVINGKLVKFNRL